MVDAANGPVLSRAQSAGGAIIPFPRLAWPGDAGRRSPSPHPGAPPATPGTPSARARAAPARRGAPGAPQPDPRAKWTVAGPREAAGHPPAGTEARRRAVDLPGNPPRGLRGGADDTAARGSTASSRRLAPSAGRDGPRRRTPRSPRSGSRGPGGAARAAAPEESCESALRSPRRARPHRAASPRGSRRTPGAATFPRRRAPSSRTDWPG